MIYWFTGQPGAGKTTQAQLLIPKLGLEVIHIDGDNLRAMSNNKDYSREGRRRNVQLAQDIAAHLHLEGYTVVVSLVAPYHDQRERLKVRIPSMIEIYVHTSEVRGREEYFAEYEPPMSDYIDLDTTGRTPDQTHVELMNLLSV